MSDSLPPGMMPGGTPQDEGERREKKWRDIIEEQISEAQKRGDFDNLRGKGKPLDLTGNPHARDWEMAYKAMANSGFVPDWVERDREIRRLLDEATGLLERHVVWYNEAVAELASVPAAQLVSRRQFIAQAKADVMSRYRARAAEINKKIRDFNLVVPIPSKQRFTVRVEQDLAEFEARLDPLP
jgi:hypothetical protein